MSDTDPPKERPLTPEQVQERCAKILETYPQDIALQVSLMLAGSVIKQHEIPFEDAAIGLAAAMMPPYPPTDPRTLNAINDAKSLLNMQRELLRIIESQTAHPVHVVGALTAAIGSYYATDARLHGVVDNLLLRAHISGVQSRRQDPIVAILDIWSDHVRYFNANDGLRLLVSAIANYARERNIDTTQLLVALATILGPQQPMSEKDTSSENSSDAAKPESDAGTASGG